MTYTHMNIPVYYHSKGTGKPIVLIHGWTMSSRVWTAFREEFSAQFRVITLDLRGHGNSRDLPGPYDFTSFAQDVALLIENLGLHDVTLIGWSMGVSVILKLFEHPLPTIDSLVFISGTPSLLARDGYPHGVPRGEAYSLLRQLKKDYTASMINFYNLMFQGKDASCADRKSIYVLIADMESVPQQTVACEAFQCLQQEDLRPSLKNIQVPALLIHGTLDRICLPAASQYMAESIDNASLFLVADTGHAPFLTERSAVHKTIKNFIQAL